MLDFLSHFGSLLHIANNCKQDFDNWKFFREQDGKLSAHFYKLAEDYFRLLLVDLHAIFGESEQERCPLPQLFSNILAGKYPECKIPKKEVSYWIAVLEQQRSIIEKICILKEKKIDYTPLGDISITMGEIKKLILVMEIIIIQMCCHEDFGLPGILTIDERYHHNITEAFRRVELAKQYTELSKQFTINKNGASVMQKVI
ncbi:hypothetical protein [Chitinophaga niabensis]|uniref:HEPN AbiU2-like domain-containing protein n=1 Tax=Chitinophaga niabensis TaxID=536979 RepID=A0A1N6JZE5_9BACT|nr:hypothetical protein [Chitinophaga niabensis]SIO49426.1 hypothetical protein SAMN04488055_4711 [Chitinophaga niabensis]